MRSTTTCSIGIFPNRDEFEVLVLTSSRRRLEALRRGGRARSAWQPARLYQFATFDVLRRTASCQRHGLTRTVSR